MDTPDSAASSAHALPDASASPDTHAEAPASADASARSNPGSRKKPSPSPAPVGNDRVGQSYRLTQNHDWGIRYAALMLETQDGQRRSQQDLVDQAVRELLERLKKKGMTFPDHLAL